MFEGTPDDWWDNAQRIMVSEASNRTLGNWYITQVRTAGNTKPGYRLSTPSKPPNADQLLRDMGAHDVVSDRVRLLIRSEIPVPAWVLSPFVFADTDHGRQLWVRKKSGRWNLLTDGRLSINDHEMMNRNPVPAVVTEATGA